MIRKQGIPILPLKGRATRMGQPVAQTDNAVGVGAALKSRSFDSLRFAPVAQDDNSLLVEAIEAVRNAGSVLRLAQDDTKKSCAQAEEVFD